MRDPRLDFFRGLGMFIILLAHTPGNPWTLWIPARFGFSDATEIFVFCSGMASAIAFGRVFDMHGMGLGAARIAFRVWQVYWAHIGTFLVIAALMVFLNALELSERNYVGQLNLWPFFKNPTENLIGLVTLTYVPNYFDILPMYLVILAMIPIVMGLSRISPQAPLVFIGVLWAATNVGRWHDGGVEWLAPLAAQLEFLHLPAQLWFAEPNNTRQWFFNPFGWQLVFFTGFAFMRGWIPAPPVRWWLIALAAVIVLATVPFAYFRITREIEWIKDWRGDYRFLFSKTDFGILRYLHFLALAYLGWTAAGAQGARLAWGRAWPRIVAIVRKVGQQSLAVFMVSMVFARLMGVAFDVFGKDTLTVILVNLTGFAVLIATAYTVAWFKGQPWRKPPPGAARAKRRPALRRGTDCGAHRMRMTRRQMGALGAAFAAFGSSGALAQQAEPGMTLGKARPFTAGSVEEIARATAARPYRAPRKVPQAWRNLKYDEYRHMWFDTRNALWRREDVPVKVDFFPPGLYFPHPIQVFAVEREQARPVLFDFGVFDTTDKLPDLPIDDSLGYSGLRFLGELEKPGIFQEYAVFQGASYFRAIGQGHVYGLSARGIALNTASDEGEEFPEFRSFWIERPAAGSEEVILHALLDGPSVAGAYRFRIMPGATTIMDVEATLFPRTELANVGIAAQTSMFLFDQTNRNRFDDFRPAVHDNDGLMIANGAGETLWRPLANPTKLQVSSFVDDGPRGFGLMQRARRFSDFSDLQAKYHQRPGLWVEPGENWGRGAVTLVEIPTEREIYDNIVAYWRPRTPLPPGQAHRFTYRLHWCSDAPVTRDRAHVLNTHMGKGFNTRRVAAIDFAPHPMTPRDPAEITPHVSTNRGKVTDGILQRNPETGGLRLDFGFEPPETRGMEMRAQLMAGGKQVSEVWLYRWTH